MSDLRAAAERTIAAPADRVYRYIADFREHHQRWLPPAFSDFQVEQGGFGAGTVSRFTMTLGGRSRTFRTEVTEPEPGRVLVETDPAAPSVTTFTVTPEGEQCRVRIETTWPSAGGIAGLFERLFAPRMLSRLYADELDRLDRYARERVKS